MRRSGAAVDFVTTDTYGVKRGFLDESGRKDTMLDPSFDAMWGTCAKFAGRSPHPILRATTIFHRMEHQLFAPVI